MFQIFIAFVSALFGVALERVARQLENLWRTTNDNAAIDSKPDNDTPDR